MVCVIGLGHLPENILPDPTLFSKSILDVSGLVDIHRLSLRGRHNAWGCHSVEAPLR